MGRIHKAESYLERLFEQAMVRNKIPHAVRQYNFHNWYFDYSWPQIKVVVEIDGGTYSKQGGHARGASYKRDCIKNNIAQLEGWVVLRADRTMVTDREFIGILKKVIINRINAGLKR
jgi:very-short-patch-repair endonuclease